MNITPLMLPQERRYRAKIAQCEANIRRFDSSGRDSPRRNYWWWQRRKWELKLQPWLKTPLLFQDFPDRTAADPALGTAALFSSLHGEFYTPEYVLTGFHRGEKFRPLQLAVDAERYRLVLANAWASKYSTLAASMRPATTSSARHAHASGSTTSPGATTSTAKQ